jgi:DNA-binding NarL/FixJ family response regulator
MPSSMRVAIVEDHAMFREVLYKICVEEFQCEVAFALGTVASAVQLLDPHRPHALLLDLGLPDGDGFIVAEAALRIVVGVRIYLLTSHINEYVIQRSQQLKVHGFIHKASSLQGLKDAIRALRDGKSYYSPEFLAAKAAWRHDPNATTKRLSDSEQRVLPLIARSFNDEEIGRELGISTKTAETHRSSILRRLKIPGTPKLIAFAIEKGFGVFGK